jgi:hypothetical protein
VDLEVLINQLVAKGYGAQVIEDSGYVIELKKKTSDNRWIPSMQVSSHFMSRLGTEFVSLGWLMDELVWQHEYINVDGRSE